MTHAVKTSTVDPAYSVRMEVGSYYFLIGKVPLLTDDVPDNIRDELEPTAKKWAEEPR